MTTGSTCEINHMVFLTYADRCNKVLDYKVIYLYEGYLQNAQFVFIFIFSCTSNYRRK